MTITLFLRSLDLARWTNVWVEVDCGCNCGEAEEIRMVSTPDILKQIRGRVQNSCHPSSLDARELAFVQCLLWCFCIILKPYLSSLKSTGCGMLILQPGHDAPLLPKLANQPARSSQDLLEPSKLVAQPCPKQSFNVSDLGLVIKSHWCLTNTKSTM
jgi:hypothetical protein